MLQPYMISSKLNLTNILSITNFVIGKNLLTKYLSKYLPILPPIGTNRKAYAKN